MLRTQRNSSCYRFGVLFVRWFVGRFGCAVGLTHSLPSFGLCVGLCDLAMCVTAALAHCILFFLKFSAWSNISKRTRRCLLNKFPYGVIYQIRDEEILVLAIAHLHRRPGYWNKNV